MRSIVIPRLLATLLLAVPAHAGNDTLFGPTQDPLGGSYVFGVKGCTKCHAINGIGPTVGPDLGRVPRPRTFYDLAAALWNHAPRMAHRMRDLGILRPQLDARETGDLIAFLYTLDYFDPRGRPDVGRQLFASKRCITCHQIAGTGGVVGPSLDELSQSETPIYLAAAMWNHGPRMMEAMSSRGIKRPKFEDRELLDLIAYINSASTGPRQGPRYVLPGRPDEGRRLFIEKRCADCHSAGGQRAGIGPDLAERGAHKTLTQFAAAMWNKAPAMLAAMRSRDVTVPLMRPDEMADLVAYFYAVRYFAEAGDRSNGLTIVTAKGCLGCHTVGGRGGKSAGDLAVAKSTDSPAGVIAALWNHSFIDAAPPAQQQQRWPTLRPGELADVVAYFDSLRVTR